MSKSPSLAAGGKVSKPENSVFLFISCTFRQISSTARSPMSFCDILMSVRGSNLAYPVNAHDRYM